MRDVKWKTLRSETFLRTRWSTYCHSEVQLPNGKISHYWYIQGKGFSLIVPLMSDGRIALTLQYRYLVDRVCYEFPAGCVEEGSSFFQTAQKELEEEIGYQAGSMREIGKFLPSKAHYSGQCKVFLAKDLKKTKQKLEDSEQIEVVYFTPDQIDSMIIDGTLDDGSSIAAWTITKQYIIN